MWHLAQTGGYSLETSSSSPSTSVVVLLAISVTVIVGIFIVAEWKIYEKAGQPGWKILIPIYNLVILFRIVNISGWWVLAYVFTVIPVYGVVASCLIGAVVSYKLATGFGRGIGTAILNFFLIGYLILGFGDAKYVGPYHGQDKSGTSEGSADPPYPSNSDSSTPVPTAPLIQ